VAGKVGREDLARRRGLTGGVAGEPEDPGAIDGVADGLPCLDVRERWLAGAERGIDRPRILRFLDWLEAERGCSAATRNQRLAVIKSFCRYTAVEQPDHLHQGTWPTSVSEAPFRSIAVAALRRSRCGPAAGSPARREAQRTTSATPWLPSAPMGARTRRNSVRQPATAGRPWSSPIPKATCQYHYPEHWSGPRGSSSPAALTAQCDGPTTRSAPVSAVRSSL
jgi:hypothetical protein